MPSLPLSGANVNNVPGGVKDECSNCGATHAPFGVVGSTTNSTVLPVGSTVSRYVPCLTRSLLRSNHVTSKHFRLGHDTHHGSSSSAGYGSGHNSETPSASPGHPGVSCCMSPNGDADGVSHTMLMFDSNPSAFDGIDMDPTSNHNSLINSRHRDMDTRRQCRVNWLVLLTIATRTVIWTSILDYLQLV